MNPIERWQQRYRWHLESVPQIMLLARSIAESPLQAQRFDRDRVDGGGEIGAQLPFTISGTDDADLLWALLVLYARDVAEQIGGSSPSVIRTAVWTTQEAQGLRAGISARDAAAQAADVVRWLVERVETIGAIAELDDAEEVLFWRIRLMRREYGLEDRPGPDRKRPCPHCGERAVIATWADVAGVEISRVFCLVCRATFEEGAADDAHLLASG